VRQRPRAELKPSQLMPQIRKKPRQELLAMDIAPSQA
jgi:hypothetical protein